MKIAIRLSLNEDRFERSLKLVKDWLFWHGHVGLYSILVILLVSGTVYLPSGWAYAGVEFERKSPPACVGDYRSASNLLSTMLILLFIGEETSV